MVHIHRRASLPILRFQRNISPNEHSCEFFFGLSSTGSENLLLWESETLVPSLIEKRPET